MKNLIHKLKIKYKIGLISIFSVLGFIFYISFNYVTFNKNSENLENIIAHDFPIMEILNSNGNTLLILESHFRESILEEDDEALELAIEHAKNIQHGLDQIVQNQPKLTEKVKAIRASFDQYFDSANLVVLLMINKSEKPAVITQKLTYMRANLKIYKQLQNELRENTIIILTKKLTQVHQSGLFSINLGGIVGLLLILFVLIATLMISQLITAPLYSVINMASEIAKGNWDAPVQIPDKKSNDELDLLIVAISSMKNQLQSHFSELTLARDSALVASDAKSSFLASMSHEIRTPMAAILGMTGLILKSQLTHQQKERITTIRASGENLLAILNNILDQSKLEAEKFELHPSDFNLRKLIGEIVDLFKPECTRKGLALEFQLLKGVPQYIHADRLRIGQVLSNIINNAIKFTQTGSIKVVIDPMSEKEGNLISFSVKDTGIGLSPDQQERLFEAFMQADSSTSRTYGGTGLGLSISKKLTELMGGEINAECNKGEGCRFWFTVLYQPVMSSTVVEEMPDSNDNWQSTRSLKLLVVEDTLVIQQLVLAILEDLNHQVKIAANGKEAVELLKNEYFELVLMDIRMPIMDGLQATKIIRAWNNKKSEIPIIALTADIAAGNIKQYTDIGMNAVCEKPIEITKLLETINKLLGEEVHSQIPGKKEAKTSHTDENELTVPSQIIQASALVKVMSDKSKWDSSIWDKESMLRRVMGKEKIFRTLITLYLKEAPLSMLSLKEQLADNNCEQARLVLHAMKGVTSNLSAIKMQNLVTEMESLTKQNNIDAVIKLMPELEQASQEIEQCLEDYLVTP